jgi:putative ABC transport system ATP-binding protein
MEMVKAVGLKRYYDTEENEVRALDDVSLSIEEGEFLAIVGTSGSGKTTLLNLLGGLDIPTEGGVWIEGQSLRDMNNEERTVFRRKYIGFVFQQYNLVPILNIYENIVLPLRLDGAKIDDELLEEIVKFLGIKEKLGNLPKELSGGQQQRVAIARALLAKPALLLADEPTGSLDSATSREVMKLLRTCGERYHQTIVVVTHQQEVAQMADRIIHLLDGKIYKKEKIHTREGEGGIA